MEAGHGPTSPLHLLAQCQNVKNTKVGVSLELEWEEFSDAMFLNWLSYLIQAFDIEHFKFFLMKTKKNSDNKS